MLSPLTRTKFQRAIAQSGSALAGWAFDNEPEKHAKDIAGLVGCPTDSLDDMVQYMKAKPAEDIVNVHTQYIVSYRTTSVRAPSSISTRFQIV